MISDATQRRASEAHARTERWVAPFLALLEHTFGLCLTFESMLNNSADQLSVNVQAAFHCSFCQR